MENGIDTSEIKIPDKTMFWAIEQFAEGQKRAQIAEELLNNLPDELKILADMDRAEAKSLLCSRLRQADPNSTKFAFKYNDHYRKSLKAVNDAMSGIMRSTLTGRVHSLTKVDSVLNQISDKLSESIEASTPENIGRPEMLNQIKTFISVCKTLHQNTNELASLVRSFDEAQMSYEKKYDKYYKR